jgi:hypothetical protein
MNGRILKLLISGTLLTSAMTLGACGGGDDTPAAVAQVVTVKKVIPEGINAALKEVRAVSVPPSFRILDIRCAGLFPGPSSLINAQLPSFVLLLDVAADDVEKAKSFGFSLLTSEEQARKGVAVCT